MWTLANPVAAIWGGGSGEKRKKDSKEGKDNNQGKGLASASTCADHKWLCW